MEGGHMDLQAARKEKGVLIAGHRGNWGGNIPPNTIASYKAALMLGVDMIETDIQSSADGVFYAYHTGEEQGCFGIGRRLGEMSAAEIDGLEFRNTMFNLSGIGVDRMDDVLSFLKGRCFINVDRGWLGSWRDTIRYLRKFGMEDQIILKSPPERELLSELEEEGPELMYMAIIKDAEQYPVVKEYKVRAVAVETNYQDMDNEISSDAFIRKLHDDGLMVWANALTLDGKKHLAAGHDDNASIIDGPDKGWGYLLDKGYDIIQTDWPSLLIDYIRTRS